MTDDLTAEDIATLAGIAESEGAPRGPDIHAYRQASVAKLLACGFIAPAPDSRYKTTAEGQDFLTSRGAGLNEA